jgi:hypothetical protein
MVVSLKVSFMKYICAQQQPLPIQPSIYLPTLRALLNLFVTQAASCYVEPTTTSSHADIIWSLKLTVMLGTSI